MICFGDTLHSMLVGYRKGLGWKEFEGRQRSEMGLHRQAGPGHTGSPGGPQTQADGLQPCSGGLGHEQRVLNKEEEYLGVQDLGGEIPARGQGWSVERPSAT